jgi:phosphatidylinositol dimannoside acyltransferase
MYLAGAGMPVTVAVEPLEPPERFEWFARFRERLGMQVVAVGPGAGAAILQALRDNHIVCLLSDRLVGPTAGVEVNFFGAKARLPAGPVTMAVRSGAPLLAAAIYYGRPAISHTIVFRRPLEIATGQRFKSTVLAGTQALASELEQLIREAPSQWHITQPNWPGDPQLHSPWAWPRVAGRSHALATANAGDE